MSTYLVGDIQGCYDALIDLLAEIHFDADSDCVWFTGDLVNRGPDSLKVLRFVYELHKKGAAITVLGNHDLHMLAVAEDLAPFHRSDTLDEIFAAPDKDELLTWLRSQPLIHHDASLNYTMVHAGFPPQWNLIDAQAFAGEVESELQGENYRGYFAQMYGDHPSLWSDELTGWDRLRFITNCFTRLRYCTAEGKHCLNEKGDLGTQAEECLPWFDVNDRKSADLRIIFGHWSTLGLHQQNGVVSLDTGCLWGGQLTAMRLDGEKEFYSRQCRRYQSPG